MKQRSAVLGPAKRRFRTRPLANKLADSPVSESLHSLRESPCFFALCAVGEKLAALDAMEMIEERARQGSNVDMDSIFAKIPPIEPLEPLYRIK